MRFLDHLKIRSKFIVVIGSLLVVLLGVGLLSIVATRIIHSNTEKTENAAQLAEKMKNLEIAHLLWMQKLETMLLNNEPVPKKFAVDGRKCGYGSWYYDKDERKLFLETYGKDSLKYLDAIKQNHLDLHTSAKDIFAKWKPRHVGLRDILRQRLADHLSWTIQLQQELYSQQPITVQVDGNMCAFGKWLNTGCKDFENAWPYFKEAMKPIRKEHIELHLLAQKIELAKTHEEKVHIFENEVLVLLGKIREQFGAIITVEDKIIEDQDAAIKIFHDKSIPSKNKVVGAIRDTIVILNKEKEKTVVS